MDTYDVVNFYCKESTTGALITSNKPVALLSGNKCSFIQSSSCDHIVEMLPPTSEFGKHHVLALPGGYRFPNELKPLMMLIPPVNKYTNDYVLDADV
ncbi:IgGFc-binding protein-like [Patella vulgata]|uniref:IgGFc-binding protein-like n=1 Tax=Patella vulgata TaxID=6465 RepID=UPI00218043A9|nr:IgGFc-binding protein-like [Patella vulgata]